MRANGPCGTSGLGGRPLEPALPQTQNRPGSGASGPVLGETWVAGGYPFRPYAGG